MPRATLYHFSCGHSMNRRDKDDVCPLCQAGILMREQPVEFMPGDWGKSPIDNPAYKEAQRQTSRAYRALIDKMPGPAER